MAEDNEINRVVMKELLALMGHGATIVGDGAECLARWRANGADLILTDCQMPCMDGFELTRAIREEERAESLPPTPIIAVTANALKGEAEKCLSEGMDGYLSKPVTIAGLEAVLKQHLSGELSDRPSKRRQIRSRG